MNKIFLRKINQPMMTNSLYLYLAHFSDYIFSILILPFVARILGPKELGYIALSQTFGVFLLLFMDFGFSLTASREVARLKKQKDKLTKYIGKMFTFKLVLIPLIIILSFLTISFFNIFQNLPHYILIVMIGAIFQGLSPTWFFQGIERLKILALSKIFFRFFGALIIFIFINDEKDGWIMLTGYSLTSILIFIHLFIYMLKKVGKINLSKINNLSKVWISSFWVLLLTIIPVIYQNFAAFFLSSIVNPIELGLYFGASKIYRAFNSLFSPIGQAVYPRLVASNEINSDETKTLFLKVFWILFILGLVFCCFLFVFPNFFIELLLGHQFLESAPTLKLFGIVLPLTAISHVIGRQWMMVKGEEKIYSLIILFASTLTAIFFLWKVDTFGIRTFPISLIIFELTTIGLIIIRKNK
jgi:polysaccharide transporter, PST family